MLAENDAKMQVPATGVQIFKLFMGGRFLKDEATFKFFQ
jgi:hypothetical protein